VIAEMRGSDVFARLTQVVPVSNANPEELGMEITKRLSSRESMIFVSNVMSNREEKQQSKNNFFM